jgi:glutamate N-acetyltransferase / amino-acid N-acetyltransferase
VETYASEKEYLGDLASRSALPAGFRAATVPIRFFPRERRVAEPLAMNLSLIALDEPTSSFAGVFTRNRFPGAPVLLGRERLSRPLTRGVLVNNKVSNVCTPRGREDAEDLLASLGGVTGTAGGEWFGASTGIIGWQLPLDEMRAALHALVSGLDGSSILPVARAIMTTDAFPKVRRASAGSASVVGIAKGAGMIEPNMATLLCFLCTDAAVDRDVLRETLAWCVQRTLNRISVDSDQSTSDTVLAFASGKRGRVDADELRAAMLSVLAGLAGDIVRNAEGGSHVIRVTVSGAPDEAVAAGIGKAIVNSPLVKTAVHGNDPNVGRIVSAIGDVAGNAGMELDPRAVAVRMGGVEIFAAGRFALDAGKEKTLSAYLRDCGWTPGLKGYPAHDRSVSIEVDLGGGTAAVEILGSDLSAEYVRENADYRS